MKSVKLPSGSYRVQKMIDGKRHSLTYDHDPTQKEMEKDIAKLRSRVNVDKRLTFKKASESYIDMKRNVLSPITVKEYTGTIDRLSDTFTSLPVNNITQADIQLEVNRLSAIRSPKTVRNYHAFIVSVINTYRPDFIIRTTLPQKVYNEPYIPTDKEVKLFLDYIKENRAKYYVLMILAAYGLRRSEILAITDKDLEGQVLHITKAKVLNANNEWVIKTTKTPKSRRDITIPKDIANMIREQGCAFEGHPGDISKIINTACKTLDIPHFSLHKLRHYFATKLLSENVDMITVMSLGGWASPDVLRKHYAHAIKEKKEKALKHIRKVIS